MVFLPLMMRNVSCRTVEDLKFCRIHLDVGQLLHVIVRYAQDSRLLENAGYSRSDCWRTLRFLHKLVKERENLSLATGETQLLQDPFLRQETKGELVKQRFNRAVGPRNIEFLLQLRHKVLIKLMVYRKASKSITCCSLALNAASIALTQ